MITLIQTRSPMELCMINHNTLLLSCVCVTTNNKHISEGFDTSAPMSLERLVAGSADRARLCFDRFVFLVVFSTIKHTMSEIHCCIT